MAETAENLAAKYQISRHEVDCYRRAEPGQSQRRAWECRGFCARGVGSRPDPERQDADRPSWAATSTCGRGTTPEALARLPPYFKKDGVVTAGNASGICDGAAALVMASEGFAAERRPGRSARLVPGPASGWSPPYMGIGPVPASRKALERAGLKLEDMDLVEVNEAFAAQYLAVEQELGLDRDRTNVDGGAIALGHPLGASGARITLHLLHALRRRGGRYGLGSACIGGGQGAAVIVEAF